MKKISKTLALALAVLMLMGMTAIHTLAEENRDTITVSVRIEGIKEPMYYNKTIEIEAGATVENLLALVNGMDSTPDIVIIGGEWGAYVSSINDLTEGDYGTMSGWLYYVNGVDPVKSISFCELQDGDVVVCFFSDKFGVGIQFPFIDLSRVYSESVISFLSEDTVYDDEWNETIVLNPVAGASVLFNGIKYTTDENGEIKITNKTGLAGLQSVLIERNDDESGVPTVLRFAPDFEIYVPFADTPENAWFGIPVEFCVSTGFFRGADNVQNLFLPKNNMTRYQLVTVLGRIAGVDVDAPSDPWYAAARDWALDSGIVNETWFEAGADASVTREMFIQLFYHTAWLAGSYDMDVKADITIATDYDAINADYSEAVSWAVASGIIHGMDSGALTINPKEEITRAQVCQMLFNYYSGQ